MSRRRRHRVLECLLLAISSSASASQNANPMPHAAAVCTSCHSFQRGVAGKTGPNLHGIYGKPAGTYDAAFQYSSALTHFGIVWGDDNLLRFIQDPRALIPGNKMSFRGIHSESIAKQIVEYLKSQSRE